MIKTTNGIVEKRIVIDDEYLDSILTETVIGEIRLFSVNHTIKKERVFHPEEGYPTIQMHFALEGTNIGNSNRTGLTYKLSDNQHNLLYIPHTDMNYKIEGNEAKFFGIQFSERFFYRFIDEDSKLLSSLWEKIEKEEESVLVNDKNLFITPTIKGVVLSMMSSNKQGFLKKLFLESKVIELLMLQLEQAEYYSYDSFIVNISDKEKLFAVKELLEQNILAEFTLKELAYKTGLNEFKLKRGFKELFGKTVFNFFNDLRMEYAKNLITDEKKNIAEVADILGYSESHHFTRAFKKKFGILPGTLK